MKIWLLTRNDSWWDENHSVVVIASSDASARKLASIDHADEGKDTWLDSEETRCEEIDANSAEKEKIICIDHRS